MRCIITVLMGMLFTTLAQAGVISVKVEMVKKSFLERENVYAKVSVTNNGAQAFTLRDRRAKNWLDFKVSRNGKTNLIAQGAKFPPMHIGPRQTKVKTVRLTGILPLSQQGNYTVRAVVSHNGDNAISRPAFFDVIGGVTVYRARHGITGKQGKVIEYRIIELNAAQDTLLYFQNYDPKTKRILVTYPLGTFLSIRKPKYMVDDMGYLNMLFQVNAKHHRYLKFNDEGKILKQEYFKQGASGVPGMVKIKGRVKVHNGILYDAEEEAKKRRAVHKISQRPPFAY